MVLLLGGSVSAGTVTVSGYISCSTGKDRPPRDFDSVRKCLDKGGKTVIVSDETQQVLTIENPSAVQGHEGHRVLVTGELSDKGIHVYSLRIL